MRCFLRIILNFAKDLLPLCPDDVDMSLVRDDVSEALQRNAGTKQALQADMEDLGDAADSIIKVARERY